MTGDNKYRVFTLRNFEKIEQISQLSEADRHAIRVVGSVLPFKTNNYVVNELIDWQNIPDDPMYQLTFPQRGMLEDPHFKQMEHALLNGHSPAEEKTISNRIRFQLNPHPAGQKEDNVPEIDGTVLTGVQHKYDQTVLFFPSHSQTCHAYCSFCFRWPQFVGIDELKFAMRETELLIKYVKKHREINDILFTGGDPMVMSAKRLRAYIEPILDANIPNLKTIRIGSKALSYWPYRFLTDRDADDVLRLFGEIVDRGYHLAFMGHFNHPVELQTNAVQLAIRRILNTGAQIRTQSPIMRHINDNANAWRDMWKTQVQLGCIPYYMFVARDTGAQHYFSVSLENSWKIFRKAYKQVSGLARTVRGPSMSAHPGKVHILGVTEIAGEKVFALRFLQGRNADWVGRPFFAKYDPDAIWLDELEPALGKEAFFFEEEIEEVVWN